VAAGTTAVDRRNARRLFRAVLETRGEAFWTPSSGSVRRSRPPTLRRLRDLTLCDPNEATSSFARVASRSALTPPTPNPELQAERG